jgi:hypothetical protein
MMDRSGFTISGIAWDRGAGISRVEISLDSGQSWRDAMRDPPLGPMPTGGSACNPPRLTPARTS